MHSYSELFAASFSRIMGGGAYNPDFIERFYTHFLASSPEVAGRFENTNMSRQKTMLHDSFTTLIDFNESRRITPQLRRLGTVHGPRHSDVAPGMYALWLESLISTVREFDQDFDSDVELAWRLTLAPGIAYLQHAYAHPETAAADT
jgi:hemoglobin-like flavoprotein